ncbi:MAG: ABC transporter permease [Myxococcales bacterium]|nr:ABC transporter permease [Myxococcales bacterium]
MLTLRLAWRNVWRNPRRSFVVVTAVAVGVAGVILTMAVNYGMVVQMVETAIITELGHIQVHAQGFEEKPEISVRLEDGGRQVIQALDAAVDVRAYSRRIRGEGLVSSPRASAGVRVWGVEPGRESQISLVSRSITDGRYLGAELRRIVLGEELASRLKVGVGDKVVLSVQELSGDLTGEALRVGGLFKSPSSELDRGSVFIRLEEAQGLFGLGDAVSEVVVLATSRANIEPLRVALDGETGDAEVKSWEDLQPVLVYFVEVFDQMAIAVYVAVFVAMAFGIANVLMMAVYDRMREIGILLSIGMSRSRLVVMIVVESVLITLVGVNAGFVISLLSVYALRDGIDLSAFSEGLAYFGVGSRILPVVRATDFVIPTFVALVTALISSAWPALRAVRFRPADAIRRV